MIGEAPFAGLEAAWPTVEAALPRFLAGENRRLQAVCDGLSEFLHASGRWSLALQFYSEAERRARASGDAHHAGWRSQNQAFIHMCRGEAPALSACVDRCELHWVGERHRSKVLCMRAWALGLRREHVQAIVVAGESLALARGSHSSDHEVPVALSTLGGSLLAAGDIAAAEALFEEAVAYAQTWGLQNHFATNTGNLADIYLARQDWPAAEAQAREALALSLAVQRLDIIGADHHRLALALQAQGRAAEALPHARQALEVYERLRVWEIREAPATLAACEAALGGPESGG